MNQNVEPQVDKLSAHDIAAAKQRSPGAWERIYHDLSPRLIGYLRGMQHADAEDVIGEVFTSMVRSIGSFDGGVDELRAWAYAIARHERIDASRSGQRHQQRVDAALTLLAADAATHAGSATGTASTIAGDDRVARLLGELTDRQREVMLLRVVSDLTIEQVAYVMQEAPPTIKALQRRAVRQLRELIDADEQLA